MFTAFYKINNWSMFFNDVTHKTCHMLHLFQNSLVNNGDLSFYFSKVSPLLTWLHLGNEHPFRYPIWVIIYSWYISKSQNSFCSKLSNHPASRIPGERARKLHQSWKAGATSVEISRVRYSIWNKNILKIHEGRGHFSKRGDVCDSSISKNEVDCILPEREELRLNVGD